MPTRSGPEMAPGTTSQPVLPRRLGLWSAIAVVVGITIGSGIFRTPASVTNRLPGPLAVFGVWIAGGIVALCGALTLAEVAGAFPDTGGIYVFIRNAWGRLPAFLFGWAELAIIRAAALGAIATTFAEYLLRVMGFDPTVAPYANWVHYVAAIAIAVIAALNYIGVRWGSLIQNVTTVAKYFGLLFIIVVAIAIGIPKTGGHFTPALPAGSFSIAPFGLALVSVLWAYDGWADLAFISGEVKDPSEIFPRALILGTVAVVVIYLLANVAYLGVMSVEEVRHSKLVAADVALRVVGPVGVTFVSITVMLSTLGTLNGSILTNPRVFFAMSADGMLFRRSPPCTRASRRRTWRSRLPRCSGSSSCCCGRSSSLPTPSSRRSCRSTRSASRRFSSSGAAPATNRPSARRSIRSRRSCSSSRRVLARQRADRRRAVAGRRWRSSA